MKVYIWLANKSTQIGWRAPVNFLHFTKEGEIKMLAGELIYTLKKKLDNSNLNKIFGCGLDILLCLAEEIIFEPRKIIVL